jgi:RNA polymerase sigma-70 factor (ECF subfamily)
MGLPHANLSSDDRSDPDAFVTLMLTHQRRIYGFIAALVPNRSDLDDVFQQTCLRLWSRRDQFDGTRPFLAWACGFARNVVLEHLRASGRTATSLSADAIDRIAAIRSASEPLAEARRKALDACMDRLGESQRELLRKRYADSRSLKDVAAAMATSPASLTMRLQRIRLALLRCIEKTIVAMGDV